MQNVNKTRDKVASMLSIAAGGLLFLSPWLFGFSGEHGASWSAWVSGLLISAVGIWAAAAELPWEKWLTLALGAWTLVSPWVVGFLALGSAVTVHAVVGAALIAIAVFEIWRSHNRPLSAA